VRKDEMNARLNAVWQSVKDLQTTTASRASLEESTRVVNQDLGARIKTDDEQTKDLKRQVEELNRRVQALAERLASIETAYRLTDLSGATGK
jgi:ubiquinone biosynthesis protein UbiJ